MNQTPEQYVEDMLDGFASLGFVPPKENSKNLYLKACWLLGLWQRSEKMLAHVEKQATVTELKRVIPLLREQQKEKR